MRHYRSHTAGQNVYITGGVATLEKPSSQGDITRVFHGGHAVEQVTSAEAEVLTAGGFDVIDTDALGAQAVLLLEPSSVDPGWSGATWANSGTGGSALNAAFLSNEQVTFTGSGFRIPVQSGGNSAVADDDGFGVVDDGTLEASMAGDWTFTMNFTPLFNNPETCRYFRKYTGINILVSGGGMIVESTRPVGGFIAAVVSNVTNGIADQGAAFIGGVRTDRHQVTLRMSDGVFSVFRGSSKILDRPVVGSPADGGDLIVGPGQIAHSCAWWTSALSDAEVLAVHAVSGSDGW